MGWVNGQKEGVDIFYFNSNIKVMQGISNQLSPHTATQPAIK